MLRRSKPDADAIHVDENTRIQVVDSMYLLGSADKEQCGAFIVRDLICFRKERTLTSRTAR